MAIREIPITPGVLAFSFKVDLDNRPFEFIFSFNSRSQIWTFDIKDDAGTTLLYKVPIFVKSVLLDQFKHDTRLPQGKLFAINLVDENASPTDENLGDDVLLLYEEVS